MVVRWIVLSAGLASLTIQQPQLFSCTQSSALLLWLNKFMFKYLANFCALQLQVAWTKFDNKFLAAKYRIVEVICMFTV